MLSPLGDGDGRRLESTARSSVDTRGVKAVPVAGPTAARKHFWHIGKQGQGIHGSTPTTRSLPYPLALLRSDVMTAYFSPSSSGLQDLSVLGLTLPALS